MGKIALIVEIVLFCNAVFWIVCFGVIYLFLSKKMNKSDREVMRHMHTENDSD